jgi:hypothetical protein
METTRPRDHVQYRYGDATPFPLQENFIDILLGVTDVCVALFKAEYNAMDRRSKQGNAQELADAEVAELERFAETVQAVLAPHLPEAKVKPTGGVQYAAHKINQSTLAALKQARKLIAKERDARARGVGKVLPDSAWRTLETFLTQCSLPETDWAIRWRSGPRTSRARVEISARTNFELEAKFDGEIPETSPWHAPRKVGDLIPGLKLRMPVKGGLFGTSPNFQSKHQRIDKYTVTEAYAGPDRDVLVLRGPGKNGIEVGVILRRGSEMEPVMSILGPTGEVVGEAFGVSSDDAMALRELWERIAPEVRGLIRYRSALLSATIQGQSIASLQHPANLAEQLLGSIAPVVREIRLRSRVPGELVLKRDLGDGRREELYVPRDELQKKFMSLPDEYRDLFEAMGLGNDATEEFASQHLAYFDTRRDFAATA